MSSCTGCTRRTLLQGIGLALTGCGLSSDNLPADAMPDAEPPVPCEPGKLCVDVSRPSSGTLGMVGGTHKISAMGDLIIIVRTGDATFETLSSVCTHERCSVRYLGGTDLRCPCHGSMFDLDGKVIRGPAQLPLRVYPNAFDAATQILTITV